MSSRTTDCYSLYGFTLSITSSPVIAQALQFRLRAFPSVSKDTPADLCFEHHLVGDADGHLVQKPVGPGRPVYEFSGGEVLFFETEHQIYVRFKDAIRILCQPITGRVSFSVVEPESEYLWLLSHSLFTLALAELLKYRGLYSVHAAGLARNGRALLLPGPRGAGKSTLAVALIRAGFGLLGDDLVFVDPTRMQLLGFSPEMDLTDQTVQFFPELNSATSERKTFPAPKRQISADTLYQTEVVRACAPGVLVFPRISGGRESRLSPIGPDEALLELVPNVLLTEARSSQAHLDAIGRLARECRCYRLETGRDLDLVPDLLRKLLDTAAVGKV